MDWWNVLGLPMGIVAGGVINWYFSRQASQELKREAERLRRLTINITYMLEAHGLIEVSERDPVTGEPTKWPVGGSLGIMYDVEPPTPWWTRPWRKVFGA